MIPKVIHYCWFGRGEKPKLALKCIESWRKFLPDYEIKEWNEDNFDVNMIPYTAEAYKAKKYAFVSDYARMWVLYHYGGLDFDTDVEVVAPLDDIIAKGAFMGIESCDHKILNVSPGLGIGVEAKHIFYQEIMHRYEQENLQCEGYIVPFTSKAMIEHGIKPINELQNVAGIWIYPQDFFNPYDYINDRLIKTNNTRTIHWYGASWLSTCGRLKLLIGKKIRKYLLR